MAAVFHNIVIPQGSRFELNIQTRNSDNTIKDLTGYDARMQVRPTRDSATILLSASTSDGRITINAPGGIVMIAIGADVTGALSFYDGVYDLEIYKVADATSPVRIAEGFVSLSPEVTR